MSLCERGYSQPPQVLPLPVSDNAIIHVDEFMSSITSTTSTHRPSPIPNSSNINHPKVSVFDKLGNLKNSTLCQIIIYSEP